MMQPTPTAFGSWSGGNYMHFGEPIGEERFYALVRRAYEKGTRTFMTADVYGEGAASVLLGKALRGIDRSTYCLVGMVGHDFYEGERDGAKGFPRFTDPALRGPDQYGGYVKMACERELERLGTDHFDLLLLHNPDHTGYSHESVWKALDAAKQVGLTRMLGIAPGPANGFTLDIIQSFEKFGGLIDWAMVILNPLEPWPGELCLPAAKKYDVKLITRVVDHGGLFHGDVRPGHRFSMSDHRAFRPDGWVEAGCEKIEKMKALAERHGLTTLQLACQWNLAHDMVKSVVPTLIEESEANKKRGDGKTIEDKCDELAALPTEVRLTAEEVAAIAKIGDNKGCMALKGASSQYLGEPQGDQWRLDGELRAVAERWHIEPDRDIYYADDPRDLREKGMPVRGVVQAEDARLYLQLQVFTGSNGVGPLVEALKRSGLESVLYANVNDPRGVGVLLLSEDPDTFVGKARDLLNSEPFSKLAPVPELTMFGRTYAFGREPDVRDWLLNHARRNTMNPAWPWAVWYPLRRKGSFYKLDRREQGKILMEHGTIGRNFGGAGYAGDVRLECFGLDKDDNEFVIGVVGPRLDWLSKLIAAMRPTTQTSEYMEKLGPFFVGKAIYQSGVK